MTALEAIALIPEWQKRLRLQDWEITAVVVDQTEDGLASANALPKYKSAKLTLLDPVKIDKDWLGNKDLEVSIVHELLHLQAEFLTKFLCKPKHRRYHDDMERWVELTARPKIPRGTAVLTMANWREYVRTTSDLWRIWRREKPKKRRRPNWVLAAELQTRQDMLVALAVIRRAERLRHRGPRLLTRVEKYRLFPNPWWLDGRPPSGGRRKKVCT